MSLDELRQLANNHALTHMPVTLDQLRTSRIYIAGGQAKFGHDMIAYAQHHQLDATLIDDFCGQDNMHGLPVVRSADVLQAAPDNAVLILCAFSRKGRLHFEQLAAQINAPIYDYMALAQTLEAFIQDHMMEDLTRRTAGHIEDFIRHADIFADDLSRQTYVSIIKARLTLDRTILEAINQGAEHMYLGAGFMPWNDQEYIIDGGAYDGDTAKLFLEKIPAQNITIKAFEPDTDNFQKLKTAFADDPRIQPVNCGLWFEKTSLSFSALGSSYSAPADGGQIIIQTRTIDEAAQGQPISFIKLDIEGAERQALQGAAQTIKHYKPKLALACYHTFDDMLELPAALKALHPDYKFYLRHYGDYFLETVLYAI